MSWKEKLKPAFLGDIPFYAESSQFDFGRTLKIDRPGGTKKGLSLEKKDETEKEGVIIKDLGPREYEIMLKAYFLGDDYIDIRIRFEEAFKAGGVQTLILPLEDPIKVIPARARRRWTNKEGGIEYIECSFYLSTKEPADRIEEDTSKDVSEKATEVSDSVEEDYSSNFSVEDTAPFVEESGIELAETFSEALDSTKGFGEVSDLFEDWSEKLDTFTLDIADLIRIPERFVADVMELIEGVETAFQNIESAINSQIELFQSFEFSSLVPGFLSDDRIQQHQNNNSMVAVFKGASLAQISQMTARQEFASKEEALERLDLVLGFIDETITTAGEEEPLEFLHEPLSNMRAALVKDMLTRAANLPSVLSLEIPAPRPIITVAYDIYGDLGNEEDLIDRNVVRNPNASPRIMEVISP